jgi:hypothetical protein
MLLHHTTMKSQAPRVTNSCSSAYTHGCRRAATGLAQHCRAINNKNTKEQAHASNVPTCSWAALQRGPPPSAAAPIAAPPAACPQTYQQNSKHGCSAHARMQPFRSMTGAAMPIHKQQKQTHEQAHATDCAHLQLQVCCCNAPLCHLALLPLLHLLLHAHRFY